MSQSPQKKLRPSSVVHQTISAKAHPMEVVTAYERLIQNERQQRGTGYNLDVANAMAHELQCLRREKNELTQQLRYSKTESRRSVDEIASLKREIEQLSHQSALFGSTQTASLKRQEAAPTQEYAAALKSKLKEVYGVNQQLEDYIKTLKDSVKVQKLQDLERHFKIYYERYNQLRIQNQDLLGQIKELQDENAFLRQKQEVVAATRTQFSAANPLAVQIPTAAAQPAVQQSAQPNYSMLNEQEQLVALQRDQPSQHTALSESFDIGSSQYESKSTSKMQQNMVSPSNVRDSQAIMSIVHDTTQKFVTQEEPPKPSRLQKKLLIEDFDPEEKTPIEFKKGLTAMELKQSSIYNQESQSKNNSRAPSTSNRRPSKDESLNIEEDNAYNEKIKPADVSSSESHQLHNAFSQDHFIQPIIPKNADLRESAVYPTIRMPTQYVEDVGPLEPKTTNYSSEFLRNQSLEAESSKVTARRNMEEMRNSVQQQIMIPVSVVPSQAQSQVHSHLRNDSSQRRSTQGSLNTSRDRSPLDLIQSMSQQPQQIVQALQKSEEQKRSFSSVKIHSKMFDDVSFSQRTDTAELEQATKEDQSFSSVKITSTMFD